MTIDGGLRGLFHKNLPGHWQAIETGGVGLGVPDSNACLSGVEVWVEFKTTSGWRAGLRPEQVAWIDRRARMGGRTFVAVRRKCDAGPRRGDAMDELWLFDGSTVKQLADIPMNEVAALGRWPGGPARWPWREITFFLFTTSA